MLYLWLYLHMYMCVGGQEVVDVTVISDAVRRGRCPVSLTLVNDWTRLEGLKDTFNIEFLIRNCIHIGTQYNQSIQF